jgi:hypothetical protein
MRTAASDVRCDGLRIRSLSTVSACVSHGVEPEGTDRVRVSGRDATLAVLGAERFKVG